MPPFLARGQVKRKHRRANTDVVGKIRRWRPTQEQPRERREQVDPGVTRRRDRAPRTWIDLEERELAARPANEIDTRQASHAQQGERFERRMEQLGLIDSCETRRRPNTRRILHRLPGDVYS